VTSDDDSESSLRQDQGGVPVYFRALAIPRSFMAAMRDFASFKAKCSGPAALAL